MTTSPPSPEQARRLLPLLRAVEEWAKGQETTEERPEGDEAPATGSSAA